MSNNIENKKTEIIAYKHNGDVHRIWREVDIVEQTESQVILANDFGKVLEGDGKNWFTPEPAVSLFYNDQFYNVMAMLKEDGIYFYCNISSQLSLIKKGLNILTMIWI